MTVINRRFNFNIFADKIHGTEIAQKMSNFLCYRVNVENMEPRLLKKYSIKAQNTPTIAFYTCTGEKIAQVAGKVLTAQAFLKLMQLTIDKNGDAIDKRKAAKEKEAADQAAK